MKTDEQKTDVIDFTGENDNPTSADNERRKENARRHEEKLRQEKEREERLVRTGRRALAVFKVVLTLCVVLSLLFISAKSFGNVTYTRVVDSLTEAFSNLRPGEGYPIETRAGDVVDIQPLGGSIAVLKRTGVFVYNSTAKLIGSAEHIFSSPGIEVSKDRMLVFDRTSGEYFLHNRTEKLFDGSLGRQIFAGAMGAKGGYALASTADDACSRLLVYSAKNEKRLEFFCSKEYIVAVALSKDEKNVCIAVVGSDAAEIYSSVYVLSVDSGKELFKKSYTGTTMMKVRYLERNAIAAVGDNKCVIFDQSGQVVAENTFPYCTLENLSFSADGKVALLLSRFGSVNDYFLRVIGSDGNVMYEKNYGERRLWVSSDSSEVAVVSQDGEVELYNNKGEVTAKATCGNPLRIVCGARNCYALEYGCISEIKVERIKN